MFWRFGGYSSVSTIDTLLDKPGTTLEELLEEQDVVQELKSHHTKLIEFLRDDQCLHKLLQYTIAPDPNAIEDEDAVDEEAAKANEEQERQEKKRMKYAYVSCEILFCETWSITEALMSNTEYLKEFWDFLRRPAPLDPLQAGYFTKVNETLLEKKTEDMLEFFKSLPDIVPTMLKHVDCPMVMDLLLKIISLEKHEGGAGIVEWLYDQDLVPQLLAYLSVDCSPSTQTSAGDFLKAIITISANATQNEQSCIGPNCLTRQLVSAPCVNQLAKHMLQGGNPLTVGVGIIIEVIRKNNSDYDPDNGFNPNTAPTNHDPIFLGTLLRIFAKHVPEFMGLILSPNHTITEGTQIQKVDRGVLRSAWGTEIEPLGFDRFKTCELMAELLHCSNMGLLNELGAEEFVTARDTQREKLRADGKLAVQRAADASTIDMSQTSSILESSFTKPSDDAQQNTEVDKVSDDPVSGRHTKITDMDDLIDEPVTPTINAADASKSNASSLNERVRRMSLDDSVDADDHEESKDLPDGLVIHPEDRPAPLFSRSKKPTISSKPTSPVIQRTQMEHDTTGEDLTDVTIAESITSQIRSREPEQVVVGDYLKKMFVEHHVVPTILSFFFRFPWNNFLHNVVYDVVQQVFNGPMDRGHNRFLAFDLFVSGKITEQITQGQRRSEVAEKERNMRLGYMGHLTLVAEEVVKFGERHPREVLSEGVRSHIYGKDWEQYVTRTLAETRDRDNAILGGFRPEHGMGSRQTVLNAVNAGSGLGGSTALAGVGLTGSAPLDSVELSNNGSGTSTGYSNSSSLGSNFGESSDDDDDDDDSEDNDERSLRSALQLTTADTGPQADSTQPVPLLPPPPAPLHPEPSRARRRLADRLAMHKQQQEESAASEFGMEDDPFMTLDEQDDNEPAVDAFALDEEEQDITTFGKRSNPEASSSRGIQGLFVTGGRGDHYLGHSPDEASSSSSGDSDEAESTAVEARTSLERRPLDVDDDEDDEEDEEEMGEMVEPTDEPNSSDEEEENSSEFDGQADQDHEDDVVEVSLPQAKNETRRHSRGSRGSIG